MTAREAKRALLAKAADLRDHYSACGACARGPAPCEVGHAKWEAVTRRQVAVIRTCVAWHHRVHRGRERADVLLEKMLRVLTAVYIKDAR